MREHIDWKLLLLFFQVNTSSLLSSDQRAGFQHCNDNVDVPVKLLEGCSLSFQNQLGDPWAALAVDVPASDCCPVPMEGAIWVNVLIVRVWVGGNLLTPSGWTSIYWASQGLPRQWCISLWHPDHTINISPSKPAELANKEGSDPCCLCHSPAQYAISADSV